MENFTTMVTGIERFTGDWNREEVTHFLNRVCFAAKEEDVARLIALGNLEDSIASVIRATENPLLEPINNYNNSDYVDAEISFGKSWVGATKRDVDSDGKRISSLKGWWLRRMIDQDMTIHEKMTLFWHNHLPVIFQDVFTARYCYFYYRTLHKHAVGNFKQLIRDITIDPAMLDFLNGKKSVKGQPDENYGRELQELFCIGKGPDSNYTEEDVQAMARVLTGWRYYFGENRLVFAHWEHDTGDKQLSEFYGNAVIQGRSGIDISNGLQELDDLLDVIFSNSETALFICRKIYRFFVSHEINEQIEEEIIKPLAETFRNENYEILPVLNQLFGSQHFYENDKKGAIIKGGIDLLIGTFRTFNVQFPEESKFRVNYEFGKTFNNILNLFNQEIGEPPNVAGWPAYRQPPEYDRLWISTSTLPFRISFLEQMIQTGMQGLDGEMVTLDLIKTTKQFEHPESPDQLISDAIKRFLAIPVSDEVRQHLKNILLSGQQSDVYWTEAWKQFQLAPNNPILFRTVHIRLVNFYSYLTRLKEYQLI